MYVYCPYNKSQNEYLNFESGIFYFNCLKHYLNFKKIISI